MSKNMEDAIIGDVVAEWKRVPKSDNLDSPDAVEKIQKYGRRMIRMEKAGRIRITDSDEKIAACLSSGLWMWLFWRIAPDLLLWIVQAIRIRLWDEYVIAAVVSRNSKRGIIHTARTADSR